MIIDGKAISRKHRQSVHEGVIQFQKKNGYSPGLAVVLVGDNPASHIYVKEKIKSCRAVGIESRAINLSESTNFQDLAKIIQDLNKDPKIYGILLQLPLPHHLPRHQAISLIDPSKDVDGLHPLNLGKLIIGEESLVPCTAMGCLHLIKEIEKNLRSKTICIIGRSLLVGIPLFHLLMKENASVIQIHKNTPNPVQLSRSADILVVAAGQPGLVTAEWVKEGAIVIDVGITRIHKNGKDSIVGDVNFDAVSKVARHITPVPGGVGPMTISYLMANTLKAAVLSQKG